MRPVGKICSCPVPYGVQSWDLEKTGCFGAPWSCSQQRKNKKKNKDTLQRYPALMGSKDPSQILEVFRQRSLIDRVSKVPLRKDSFPNAQLRPLSERQTMLIEAHSKPPEMQTQCVTAALSSSPFSPGLPLNAREVPQDWKRKGIWETHAVHSLPSPSECRPHQWKGLPNREGRVTTNPGKAESWAARSPLDNTGREHFSQHQHQVGKFQGGW